MTYYATKCRLPSLALCALNGCFLFVAFTPCEAQNLIPNSSFEEADTCLVLNTYYYPDTGPMHWFTAGGSTDHFQSCLPYGAFNAVPLNMAAYQQPFEGEAYGGLVTYNEQFGVREYWMVQLYTSLTVGQTYYASFRANAAYRNDGQSDQAWIASSGIGMLFTTEARQFEPGDLMPEPNNYAHVIHSSILADTASWVLVSGSFVADSAYQYVMLGNHFDNEQTDTLHLENLSISGRGYTLIDNVCVSHDEYSCPLATGTTEVPGEAVMVYPNPTSEQLNLAGIASATTGVVLDWSGRAIWVGPLSMHHFTLDVSDWARGSYVLRLHDPMGNRSFRFVLTE